ncbi:hypothetical protein J1605_000015 [Eschrichtius robustus]|uniref:Uncharacterized protein n=1 Tax=Eschrichtius robustus TaxID=9764 RepID=A0AB34I3G0_ESCRO|nr:hypothetical protein J1605_000015 [Eschrichtius robustus]
MSSARDASGHFPLHVLVWNNDYRQLEKELQGQVRGEAGVRPRREEGGVGGRIASLSPSPALCPRGPADPFHSAVVGQ